MHCLKDLAELNADLNAQFFAQIAQMLGKRVKRTRRGRDIRHQYHIEKPRHDRLRNIQDIYIAFIENGADLGDNAF